MSKLKMTFSTVFLGLFFFVGTLPMVCRAQESQTDEFTLEEITVTAQKRETDLQKNRIPRGSPLRQGSQ